MNRKTSIVTIHGFEKSYVGLKEALGKLNYNGGSDTGDFVKSISVNGGTAQTPVGGNVNIQVQGGEQVSVIQPDPADGTFTIRVGSNDFTVNLNHTHPQYLKYELLADEAAYEAIAIKDSATLYLIPVEE